MRCERGKDHEPVSSIPLNQVCTRVLGGKI